jgi:hypothetical protein
VACSPERAQDAAKVAGWAACAVGAAEMLMGLAGLTGTASGMAHIFLGWGLSRFTSRAAAVALLLEASSSFFVALSAAGLEYWLVNLLPSALVMILGALGLRSAAVYHRVVDSRTLMGNVLKKGFIAAAYSGVVLFIASFLNHGVTSELDKLLVLGPAYLALTAGLAGWLPFTQGIPFTSSR